MPTTVTDKPSTFRPLPALPQQWFSLAHAFIHQARLTPDAVAIEDTTGVRLTYHETLLKSIAIANILRQSLGTAKFVGVLLPPSAASALMNIAVTFLGKVPVNLNYTSSQKIFDSCVRQCAIEKILTSNKVLERFHLESQAAFIIIDTLQAKASPLLKVLSWCEATVIPEKILAIVLKGLNQSYSDNRLDDIATVIFTAGSTGDPKGVMLSHRNVLSNLFAIKVHKNSTDNEVVLGVAPFFHAFGFTAALWTVLALGYKGIYHHDPFDAQIIGKLCQQHKATIMFCTPTMMRAYARRCKAEQFVSLKFFVAGGEKLKPELAREVEKQLGVVPLEGYGLTETSPVISCTLHEDIVLADGRKLPGKKPGTVGLPLPGTMVQVVDLSTNKALPPNSEGMIWVKGPQVMQGYLNKPDETAKVKHDEWFITGDLGLIDTDGFISITGRLSQFSKIGGEMVPHLAIEREILHLTGSSEHPFAVTSVADAKRGERLAVVYSDLGMSPPELVKHLGDSGMSKLWIPDAGDFVRVDEIPVMGTGKIDLRKIKEIASLAINRESQTS
jgi:acyl-[acyl-carrier-protein]-phospholipid O-acyltransferase/long-chain-fatty-acid--[acyl-carrier-protein] ligase